MQDWTAILVCGREVRLRNEDVAASLDRLKKEGKTVEVLPKPGVIENCAEPVVETEPEPAPAQSQVQEPVQEPAGRSKRPRRK